MEIKKLKRIEEVVKSKVDANLKTLVEGSGLSHGEPVKLNGTVVKWGSREHIAELEKIASGLSDLKELYNMGSNKRYIYATAQKKLRELINSLIEKREQRKQVKIPPTNPIA